LRRPPRLEWGPQKPVTIARLKLCPWNTRRELYQKVGNFVGSVASPILANVYLHELDEKIEEIRQRLTSGKKKRPNPLHKQLSAQKQLLAKRNRADTKECRDLIRQIRSIPAVDVCDPNFNRVKYIRYADDWVD